MLGKILGAFAGAKAAEHSNMSGTTGAVLGAAGVTLLKRMSWPALIVLTAGGYALKKWSDSREASEARRRNFETPPAGAAI